MESCRASLESRKSIVLSVKEERLPLLEGALNPMLIRLYKYINLRVEDERWQVHTIPIIDIEFINSCEFALSPP